MTDEACARCGKDPAEGFASIGTVYEMRRYCHGDTKPSCYELGQRDLGDPWDIESGWYAPLRRFLGGR